MTALVNEKCIGCTLCTQICPEVFEMKGEKAAAYVNPVPPQFEISCKQSADECPVEAIEIH